MSGKPGDGGAPAGDLVAALSDERGFLSAVLDTATAAVFAETFEGVILSWNPAARSLLGYAPWEVVGRNEEMLLPAGGFEQLRGMLASVRSGERVEASLERVHKNGHRLVVEQTLVPVRDSNGSILGAAAVCRPPAGGAGESRFHALVEQSPDVVFRLRLRPDRRFEYLNPAVATLTGHGPESHYRDPDLFWSLVAPEDRAVVDALLAGTADDAVRKPRVLRMRHPDRDSIWIEIIAVPVGGVDGVDVIEGIARDVSNATRLERESRETTERLRLALEAANQGLFDLDFRTGAATISPQLARMIGVDPAVGSIPIDRLRTWIHPGDAARVMVLIQDLAAGRRDSYETEYRVLARNGETRWIMSAGRAAERDEAGRTLRVFGTLTDLTTLREAERASRDMEDRHWALFENMAQGAIYLDAFGEIIGANPAAVEILGVPLDHLLGRSGRDLRLNAIREDGSEFDHADFPGVIARKTGREVNGVVMGIANRRDGQLRWILAHARPQFRPGEERPYLVYVTFTDITAIREARSALRLGEERYRAIVENTPDVIARFDRECRYLYVSPAIRRFGPFDPAEFPGRTRADVGIPADLAERWDEAVREVFADGRPREEETDFPTPDGLRHVFLRVLPEYDGAGNIATVVTIIQDVTARHNLEHQFRQAQKMEAVGRLAGGVAHDFNNLLTAIRSYASFLTSSLTEGDPRRSDAQEIERAAESAATLTRQLLAFSRKQVLQPQILDLGRVVSDVEGMLRRLIRADVELDVALEQVGPSVRADRGQIEQVLVNLVINARDAMPKGGRIEIGVGPLEIPPDEAGRYGEVPPGDWILLSVADTGVGIAEAIRGEVFEPFFTTKEPGRGSGLGLSTVYGIVKQSGGHIEFDTGEGTGTTFRVFLPRAQGLEAAKSMSELADVPGGMETVLVAEDDHVVRSLAIRTLRSLGYNVLEAREGNEAITIAAEAATPPDLLLADIIMPGMSGRQLGRLLAASQPDIAIIYMSGYADDMITRQDLFEENAIFIEKPFTPTGLGQRVRQALDHRAQRIASTEE